jgi:3-keto-disaccharide hydrolase
MIRGLLAAAETTCNGFVMKRVFKRPPAVERRVIDLLPCTCEERKTMCSNGAACVLAILGVAAFLSASADKNQAPKADPSVRAASPPAADADGFVPLFNGKDLSGWIGNVTGYVPEADGKLVCVPGRGKGNLYTAKEYANFVLRFEFKLTPGANNGLGIRAPTEGDAAYVGMEIQILDDSAEVYKDIQPWQHHGSIYNVVAAKPGHLKPVGEWNREEVTADGRHVVVKLNGATIVDANLDDVKDPKTLAHHPGLARKTGHIGFLGHGSPLAFRNIRIKELP